MTNIDVIELKLKTMLTEQTWETSVRVCHCLAYLDYINIIMVVVKYKLLIFK